MAVSAHTTTEDIELLDRFRRSRIYSIPEAARLVGTEPQTVRRWIDGLDPVGTTTGTVLTAPGEAGRRRVSFLELVELAVAARFRRGTNGHSGSPVARIRRARARAQRELGVEYPFASLTMQQRGPHILYDFETEETGAHAMALEANGRCIFPVAVQSILDSLTYDKHRHLAATWHPFGNDVPIVIDPLIAAGQPVIEGTGARVATIRARIQAGDPRDMVANDISSDMKLALLVRRKDWLRGRFERETRPFAYRIDKSRRVRKLNLRLTQSLSRPDM